MQKRVGGLYESRLDEDAGLFRISHFSVSFRVLLQSILRGKWNSLGRIDRSTINVKYF